jgi:NADPH:quinone reductase-like Zn-dependent oxidoreductase
MRAIQMDRPGGPQVLTVREVDEPVVGPGEVLVRTIASSINPVDWKTRSQANAAQPMTLGWDLAGVVVPSEVPA